MNLAKIKQNLNHHVPKLIREVGLVVNPFLLRWFKEESRLLIFYFHGLYKTDSEKDKCHVDPQNNISVDQFREFVEYFKSNGYQFISHKDFEKGLNPKGSYIMATFDDGYFNNTYALEVMEEYNVPATFFISTRYVIKEASYWWDVVYKNRIRQGISLSAIRREQDRLKSHSVDFIADYLYKNFGSNCEVPWSDIDRPMNGNELKDFASHELVTIGNHTHNHAILTRCTTKEVAEELGLCNKYLVDMTGESPSAIAFPNGNYNRSVVKTAKECGLKYSYSIVQRVNKLPLDRSESVVLSRFMARTTDVQKYASFCRLGYTGSGLFERFKKVVLPSLMPVLLRVQEFFGEVVLEISML